MEATFKVSVGNLVLVEQMLAEFASSLLGKKFSKLGIKWSYSWGKIFKNDKELHLSIEDKVIGIEGYRLLAKVSRGVSVAGNDIREVVSIDKSRDWGTYECKFSCKHCATKHFRNSIFLMEDSDKNIVEFGTSCVEKYFLKESADIVLKAFYSILAMFESNALYCEGDEDEVRIKRGFNSCLAITAGLDIARSSGNYIKATEMGSNSHYIDSVLFSGGIANHEDADKVRSYWVSKWENDKSDFNGNIVNALFGHKKSSGLIAWGCFDYWKSCEKVETSELFLNEWYGDIKERFELDLVLKKIIPMFNIHLFSDSLGREFKWFNSSGIELSVGMKYRIKGTIKSHDLWKDKKSTQLNRVKVI